MNFDVEPEFGIEITAAFNNKCKDKIHEYGNVAWLWPVNLCDIDSVMSICDSKKC